MRRGPGQRHLSIALLPQDNEHWVAGELYSQHIFKSLITYRRNHPEVAFKLGIVCSDPEQLIGGDPIYQDADGVISPSRGLSNRLRRGVVRAINKSLPKSLHHRNAGMALALRDAGVDFAYPFATPTRPWLGPMGAAWITDLQHRHLPEFFSSEECHGRDREFSELASHASDIVFSSSDAFHDFQEFFPGSKNRSHIFRFCSIPDPSVWDGDPLAVQQRYHLPDRFLLCCGQFWAHKNQGLLLESLAEIQESHDDIFVVFTGHLNDYRQPQHVDNLFTVISQHNLRDRIAVLGLIPRQDQLQIMRRSVAVVQPSLFEGWSTVVEDARSLGKPIVLSDLAVHQEQAPPDGIFFERTSSASLTESLLTAWSKYSPGPDQNKETTARRNALELIDRMAADFLGIARDCVASAPRRNRP